MIELMIALVALMAVFAGMLQIARLGQARSAALQDARREAGRFALAETYAVEMPGPQFLYGWQAGGDGRTHSADDQAVQASTRLVETGLLSPARPGDLDARVPGNAVSGLQNISPLVNGLDLVHGREQTDDIPLYPVVRHLLYDAESIRITADAWLTWTRGVE